MNFKPKLQRFKETTSPDYFTFQKISFSSLNESLKTNYSQILNSSYQFKENLNNNEAEKNSLKKILESLKQNYPHVYSSISPHLNNILREEKKIDLDSPNKENLIFYRFPIARINEKYPNGNNRKYVRKLWENVINNQRSEWAGRVGLADHPADDEEGEFKHSAIVWLDLQIDPYVYGEPDDNKFVWGIGVFVGPYGRLAQEIIEVGGIIGFSTSGFGELLDDGVTVNPDTYIIERCADIVLNPSQSVYGSKSNKLNIEYDLKDPKDSITFNNTTYYNNNLRKNNENIILTKENNNNKGSKTMNNNVNDNVSYIEEKIFLKNISSLLEDIPKLYDKPQDRIKEYQNILNSFDHSKYSFLKEKIEKEILNENKLLEKAVNVLNQTEKLEEKYGKDIDLKIEELTEKVKTMKKELKDWESISSALKEKNDLLKKENKELKDNLEKYYQIKENYENMKEKNEKIISNLKNQVKNLESKLNRYESNLKEKNLNETKLSEKMKNLLKLTQEKNKIYEEKINQKNKELNEMKKIIKEINIENEDLKEEIEKLKKELSNIKKDAKNKVDYLENEKIQLTNKLKETEMFHYGRYDRLLKEKMELEEKIKLYEQKYAPIYNVDIIVEENKNNNLKNKILFKENIESIEKYWADLYTKYGESIKPYEKYIRGAKTLKEATSNFLKILNDIDINNKIIENTYIPDSVAITKEERKRILKENGVNLQEKKTLNLPKGWV